MNIYEFETRFQDLGTNINHSQHAILAAQYFANFFVGEARKNLNKFPSKQEEVDSLIYNYPPVYSAKYKLFHEQMYVF